MKKGFTLKGKKINLTILVVGIIMISIVGTKAATAISSSMVTYNDRTVKETLDELIELGFQYENNYNSILEALKNKDIIENTEAETSDVINAIENINFGYTIDTLYNIYQYSAKSSSGNIAILDVEKYNQVTINSISFTQQNNMKVQVLKDDVVYATYATDTNGIVIDVTNTSKLTINLVAGTGSSVTVTIRGVTVS